MDVVIFLRSIDCNPDPRVQKYIDFLDSEGRNSHIICWDRSMRCSDDHGHTYYKRLAKFGTGLRNMSGILGFNMFLFKKLYQYRKTYKVIHACDFDTVLPALFFKVFFKKKIIYDIFDWFIDSRNCSSRFIKSAILFLEKISLKLSDVVIICDERRREQLNYKPKNLWILPNIPQIKINDYTIPEYVDPNKLYLAYVGILSDDRGLDKILKCVSGYQNVVLNIAGFGLLSDLTKGYGEKYSNIHYHGTVPYSSGIEIMRQADIIIATYEKKSVNNIYAAPNKYYEGLFLGKPILTTENTIIADSTLYYQTGFVIGEELSDYESFFSDIKSLKEHCLAYGKNAKQLWNNKYANYVENFMREKYMKFIQLSYRN